MQATHVAGADTGADLEFYLGSFVNCPLLTKQEERDTDLRKWAAVRCCLRLLANDAAGRELLAEFSDACLHSPPNPETYQPRASYFHLRKDIASLLPGKPGAIVLATLQQQIARGESATALIKCLDGADWPATLVMGLAVVELRALGTPFRDPSADALAAWLETWHRRCRPADARLASDLQHAVLRYLANRDRLVLHNMRLVYKLARDNQNRSIPLRDLVQEGSAGLVRAAEKFNYRLGYRFTTYAYNWINQHMGRACEGNGSLITYPAHVHQQINQLHRLRIERRESTGVDPTPKELAKQAGLPLAKVRELQLLTNITVPMDQPLADGGSLTWANALPDPAAERAAKTADDVLLRRLVEHKLEDLEDMEQKVVRGRFGLQGSAPQTLRQLADQLNISSEWARQLEKSALAKLRDDRHLSAAHSHIEA